MFGPERRRRWTEDERRRLLAMAFAPGAVVTQVARDNDVSTSMIYKWRQESRPDHRGGLLGAQPAQILRTGRHRQQRA